MGDRTFAVRLLKFIAAIPPRGLEALVWFIYWSSYPFTARDRRIILSNVQRVYGLPPHSSFSKLFVRQNQTAQALIILETLKYIFRPQDIVIQGFDEAQRMLRAAARTTGLVVITGHHGSWELAGHGVAKCLAEPFHVLAKPSKSRWLTPILNLLRERLGMKVLWTDSKTLLREMMAIAQKNEHLGFVMDQRPGSKQGGHLCNFLGVSSTQIVAGPALMATRKKMPVFGAYMMRTGLCRYRLYCEQILAPDHEEADEQVVAQKMADSLTSIIKKYPEQWSWNYRRWK